MHIVDLDKHPNILFKYQKYLGNYEIILEFKEN